MITQFYCLDCKKFFVQSVSRDYASGYAVCPHCDSKNIEIITKPETED